MRKEDPMLFPQLLKSCGNWVLSRLSGFGIRARAGTLYFAPVAPRTARLELPAHVPPL